MIGGGGPGSRHFDVLRAAGHAKDKERIRNPRILWKSASSTDCNLIKYSLSLYIYMYVYAHMYLCMCVYVYVCIHIQRVADNILFMSLYTFICLYLLSYFLIYLS